MSCLRAGVSRTALVAAAISLWAPVPLLAESFTVTSGTTDTTAKTVTGTDTGTVQGGGTLNVTGTAITWSGPSPAPGVVINNSGTISATVRAIDTSGGSTVRNFTLNNNAGALITSVNDAFRINSDRDQQFGHHRLDRRRPGAQPQRHRLHRGQSNDHQLRLWRDQRCSQ
jgi:hypothetical protein